MSQIVVENNKVKYTPLREGIQGSFEQQQGTHLFGQPLSSSSSHITGTYTLSTEDPLYIKLSTYTNDSVMKYIIHGTIEKSNITDDILYYQLYIHGKMIIIPANPYYITDVVNINIYSHYDYKPDFIDCTIEAINSNYENVNNVDIKIDFVTDAYTY